MRRSVWLVFFGLCACGSSSDPSDGGATPAVTAAIVKGEVLVEVELAPLPLRISVPPGGRGAIDMSTGNRKASTVDAGSGQSLHVHETAEPLAVLKKQVEEDAQRLRFKSWAKEGKDTAIAEVDVQGKTGFLGLATKEVAGRRYVCKTTGLDGVKSLEAAEKVLALCEGISAK